MLDFNRIIIFLLVPWYTNSISQLNKYFLLISDGDMYDVAPKISEAGKPIFMYNIDDLVGKLLVYVILKNIFCVLKNIAQLLKFS